MVKWCSYCVDVTMDEGGDNPSCPACDGRWYYEADKPENDWCQHCMLHGDHYDDCPARKRDGDAPSTEQT